ncbi:hypothetical protein VFPPC_15628 [Pochonia chlamydosporia 170]|uniref:Uncharacterized protein n=1 Tax=Pochonia chlamydosporia 170 TaxID=1380566 RepID=A0A179G0W1_METCM|nr:hypothetical protein VFPPC_15628 [Pochonia chlamydosporia 170]OAQ70869.1 hypothetical protein VFPPC_15628 [Pochonia chlamydosporia 170]
MAPSNVLPVVNNGRGSTRQASAVHCPLFARPETLIQSLIPDPQISATFFHPQTEMNNER